MPASPAPRVTAELWYQAATPPIPQSACLQEGFQENLVEPVTQETRFPSSARPARQLPRARHWPLFCFSMLCVACSLLSFWFPAEPRVELPFSIARPQGWRNGPHPEGLQAVDWKPQQNQHSGWKLSLLHVRGDGDIHTTPPPGAAATTALSDSTPRSVFVTLEPSP